MIPESDIRNSSILIVDDQEINVNLLEGVLANAGYTRVTSSMQPRNVCALHRTHGYDLILLDLQMPGMDGFEVIEGLKTNIVDGYLPVLVLTAQPAHKVRALRLGVRDFISKPFDLVEVKARIRNMLEVRLLYKRLGEENERLEARVKERTAELAESEARYRSLTELAADWFWEQDIHGAFTRVSGPVLDMLGIKVESFIDGGAPPAAAGWNDVQRDALRDLIAAREPFLDFLLSRVNSNGSMQCFQVSGQPMFDRACRFIGYRGVGIELTGRA